MSKSAMDLVTSLVAGYAAYGNYKNKLFREETYLKKAKLDSSTFETAYPLGYRFVRAKAPEITVKYVNTNEIFLDEGDVLGEVEIDKQMYPIVYFDRPRKLVYNDIIQLKIGSYKTLSYNTFLQKFNSITIEPSTYRSIDNDNIKVYSNGELIPTSILFEDFVLNNVISNMSKDNVSAILYINDTENNLGVQDIGDIEIKFLETDGKVEIIDRTKISFFKSGFYFDSVYSHGINEDTIEKIKLMAPLLRTTKSRAVTLQDYKYYTMNSNIFEDVFLEPEQNTPGTWKLDFEEGDDFDGEFLDYQINIEGAKKTFRKFTNETMNDFKLRISSEFYEHKLVQPKTFKTETGDIEFFLEQKYVQREIHISANENVIITKINDFIKGQSCTLNVFYVKKGNSVLRETLVTSELMYLDQYIKNYAIVGINIVYIPALPKVSGVALEVKVVDDKFQEEVYDFIKEKIKEYEYKINTSFELEHIISVITKYKTYDNGIEIYPVQYVKSLNDNNSINSSKYEYLVFHGIDVSFVG